MTLALWAAIVGVAFGLLAKPAPSPEAAARLDQLVLYFPPMRLPEFLAGMVLHALHARLRWSPPRLLLVLAPLCGLVLLELLVDLLPRAMLNLGASAVLWAPLLLAGASMRTGLLCHPLAIFLGKVSYGLYLLHAPIAIYADFIDRRLFAGALGTEPWGLAALAFALAVTAAILLHLFLEEPLRRRIGGRGSSRALTIRRAA